MILGELKTPHLRRNKYSPISIYLVANLSPLTPCHMPLLLGDHHDRGKCYHLGSKEGQTPSGVCVCEYNLNDEVGTDLD